MKNKYVFWTIGTIITLLGLPAYIMGFVWQFCRDEFNAGVRKQRMFIIWINKFYKSLYK